MYALNLDNDGRILSVTYEQYAAPGQPIVDTLPEGDIADWKRVDGEYVYDPLPKPAVVPAADANIPAGKYFMAGEALYLSTAAIAAGEAIVPGSNCVKTSMSEALNALNS